MIPNFTTQVQSTNAMISQSHTFFTLDEALANAAEYARNRNAEKEMRLEAYQRMATPKKTLWSNIKKYCFAIL